jgi:hypothetical protein
LLDCKNKKNLIDVLTRCNNQIKNSIIKKVLISDTALYEDDVWVGSMSNIIRRPFSF